MIGKPIPVIYKTFITKVRLSSHNLTIECCRYFAISTRNRLCIFCDNDIEDEKHFVLKCARYQGLRTLLFRKTFFA